LAFNIDETGLFWKCLLSKTPVKIIYQCKDAYFCCFRNLSLYFTCYFYLR
jgi:hypothetical protein